MAGQSPLGRLIGPARLAPYARAADGDATRATDLYLWATQVSGALHAQISFVEVAVRNAIDVELSDWNARNGGGARWTNSGGTADPLYSLVRKQLADARSRAEREAKERPRSHPRHGAGMDHDDVVAQLMLGSWVKIVRPVSAAESPERQRTLWQEATHRAFPNAGGDERSRVELGDQLETLRRLRNRVAHHDNLLEVNLRGRLSGMLSLLAKIDDGFPALAMARSGLRQLVGDDPRRTWS